MLKAFEEPNITINILSESLVKAKRQLVPDMKNIVFKELWSTINFNKSESLITFPNNSVIRFISGEDADKVVGIRSTYLYADEVNTIKKEVIDELAMRTKKLIIASFNPTNMFNWYEETISKPGAYEDVSNYLDNPFLSKAIIEDILNRAKHNANFKRIHIDGEFGSYEGLVFVENKDYYIQEFPEQFDIEAMGMDIGYTNPTTLIHARIIGNSIYLKELLYERNLITRDIAAKVKQYNPDNIRVIADSADPSKIKEFKRIYGLSFKAVEKKTVLESIDNLKNRQIFIDPLSKNLLMEFRNYIYSKTAKDKKGRPIPIKEYDHGIDATRYITDTYFKSRSNKKGRVIKI